LDNGDAAQGIEIDGSGDLRHRLKDVSVGASQTPVEGKEEEYAGRRCHNCRRGSYGESYMPLYFLNVSSARWAGKRL